MSTNSKIEWTDHTFNGWIGCTKVSPACLHCYAEVATPTRVARAQGRELWGAGMPRQRTSEATWRLPMVWNRLAENGGFRECPGCGYRGTEECGCGNTWEDMHAAHPRVFCASLADWLDDEVPIEWLADLLAIIHATPNLDWQLLTKRPENFGPRLRAAFEAGHYGIGTGGHSIMEDWLDGIAPANIWIGTTVEDPTRADERIPKLLEIPARVRFLSCEPLLGPVDLAFGNPKHRTAESYHAEIHWVICGGESGPDARPMHPDWARSLRDQCAEAGVPFFFKQWGEWSPNAPEDDAVAARLCKWVTPSGQAIEHGDPSEDEPMFRVGKKAAGRLLDGREHNEFPEVQP